MTKCLLVMAGGTGGHVFPGIAVADLLHAQGWSIHWLGTAKRMEADIVPKAGYPISFIDVAGLRGNGVVGWLTAPFKLLRAVFQALSVIRKVNPDVVLGMGGFASGPGGVAAWLKRIPLVLHEQNAVAGFTNKLLAPLASRILTGFEGTFKPQQKVSWVGNPLRASIGQTAPVERADARCNILVVGGSLGAQALNQAMPVALQDLPHCAIRHQCGAQRQQQVEALYRQVGIERNVQVDEFIDDMASAYQWADLIICRAGALTVSEIAMAGKAAIFVPLPHAVDDHQTQNAMTLVNAGAALLVKQGDDLAAKVSACLRELSSNQAKLAQMGKAALTVAKPDATRVVANICNELAGAIKIT
ncbi:undecaprenyldiphospho-muramoylpentapeptide beta-N-acetylglucosaminyltransferase [Neptunicella sp. SCSIO 80796]|uniref:undecaprenyldiphospho-muramoylpentapeptide beta-N-acetylglucosaminyltransferase n=1 Tax=Neptunicella plasticusilytica TaxID=3117012 RepID=UPI003A4DBB8A